MIGFAPTYYVYRTPMGRITLACDGNALTHFAFGVASFSGEQRACALTNEASSEVLEYLAGKRKNFTVPLNPEGSGFQKKVWDAICAIPYGKTCSYDEIAAKLGNPNGRNAIAKACNQNPLPIFIPTHRVIGAHGDIGGFVAGSAVKQFLIELESRA